jgi:hypothetical protein
MLDGPEPKGRVVVAPPELAAELAELLLRIGLYPIVTSQYSSTTLCQFSDHIQ